MKFLSTIAFILVTAFWAIAQDPTPHVNPDFDPTAQPETITVHYPWYCYVIAIVVMAFFICLIAKPRMVAGWFGIKSNKTSDSEGGIH
jgi:hypothetical protein